MIRPEIRDLVIKATVDTNELTNVVDTIHNNFEKMYSKEDVATLIRRCFAGVEGKYTIEEPLKINDWIKENL